MNRGEKKVKQTTEKPSTENGQVSEHQRILGLFNRLLRYRRTIMRSSLCATTATTVY